MISPFANISDELINLFNFDDYKFNQSNLKIKKYVNNNLRIKRKLSSSKSTEIFTKKPPKKYVDKDNYAGILMVEHKCPFKVRFNLDK